MSSQVNRPTKTITSLLRLYKSAFSWNCHYLNATFTTFLKTKNNEVKKRLK